MGAQQSRFLDQQKDLDLYTSVNKFPLDLKVTNLVVIHYYKLFVGIILSLSHTSKPSSVVTLFLSLTLHLLRTVWRTISTTTGSTVKVSSTPRWCRIGPGPSRRTRLSSFTGFCLRSGRCLMRPVPGVDALLAHLLRDMVGGAGLLTLLVRNDRMLWLNSHTISVELLMN